MFLCVQFISILNISKRQWNKSDTQHSKGHNYRFVFPMLKYIIKTTLIYEILMEIQTSYVTYMVKYASCHVMSSSET